MYDKLKHEYAEHINTCKRCVVRFTITNELCRRGCCPDARISYWTISYACPLAKELLKKIEALF